jgi:hypothetical protein
MAHSTGLASAQGLGLMAQPSCEDGPLHQCGATVANRQQGIPEGTRGRRGWRQAGRQRWGLTDAAQRWGGGGGLEAAL